jgi:putative phage-type endonuclease
MDYSEFVQSRKSYLGASDAPVVMGVSPWRSPYQLWEDKLGVSKEQEDNYAMKRGRELEPVARDAYQIYTGNIVEPKQVFHPKIKYMMANLDGFSKDGSVAVEIKCPGEKDHDLAKQGIVPEKYRPQLQHQLEVIGIDSVHYFSYRDGDTALIEVGRDESYIKRLCTEEKRFWGYVESLTPPPLTDRDFAKRNDLAWVSAASEWAKITEEIQNLKSRQDEYRDTLVKLSGNQNTIGKGVKLQKIVRKGGVDYKSIPELKDIDLEKFRKKAIESWRISII